MSPLFVHDPKSIVKLAENVSVVFAKPSSANSIVLKFEKSSNSNSIVLKFGKSSSSKFIVLSCSNQKLPVLRLRYPAPVDTLKEGARACSTTASSFAGGLVPPGLLSATSKFTSVA